MRKIFQDQWQGIYFRDFTEVSSAKLADRAFYDKFYGRLFAKYSDFSGLNPEWVNSKLGIARFLMNRLSKKDIKILSLGCGLGIIEKFLNDNGYKSLDIAEGSGEPFKWIRKYFLQERVFIGTFPSFLPYDRVYDVIYLSAAEYFMDKAELADFLRKIRDRLSKSGKFILISSSFELSGIFEELAAFTKNNIKYLLELLHIRPRGQFWGYSRSRNDFYRVMTDAGFSHIEDGFVDSKAKNIAYWIEGGF